MIKNRAWGAGLPLAKGLLIRVIPGLLNLFTLFVLGDRLATEEFGVYSTTVATAALLGSLLLGPILFGILPEINEATRHSERSEFVGLITSSVLAALIFVLPFMLLARGYEPAALAVAACGGMSVLQEVLRGQLRVWAYGFVAALQSSLYAGSIFALVGPGQADRALWCFALSYLAGTILAYAMLGFPSPRLRSIGRLRRVLTIGGPYTLSVVVESGLAIGSRYCIMFLGDPHFLGIYSFCLDVSQRLIAFLINAASFMYVPMAFHSAKQNQSSPEAFSRVLKEGAIIGGGTALCSLLLLVGVRSLGLLPADVGEMLPPLVFIPVALGLSVNRLKKLAIDPWAMRANRTTAVLVGFLFAGPATLALMCAVLLIWPDWSVAYVLPLGYALAAFVTWMLVRPDRSRAL